MAKSSWLQPDSQLQQQSVHHHLQKVKKENICTAFVFLDKEKMYSACPRGACVIITGYLPSVTDVLLDQEAGALIHKVSDTWHSWNLNRVVVIVSTLVCNDHFTDISSSTVAHVAEMKPCFALVRPVVASFQRCRCMTLTSLFCTVHLSEKTCHLRQKELISSDTYYSNGSDNQEPVLESHP